MSSSAALINVTPPSNQSSVLHTMAASTPSKNSTKRLSPADFLFGTTLGEGAYARVIHVKRKGSQEEFACKIMDQRFIKKENKVKFVLMEKQVLTRLSHPKIIKMYYSFRDANYLYMMMELCHGGELLALIKEKQEDQLMLGNKDRACSLEISRFYAAEIVQALEYLHSNSVIHRDLKPENILLCSNGHIKIIDLGTAKDETSDEGKHNAFCGTAEYVSPEVLRDEEASVGADLWALGCIIFQLLVGRPHFRDENEYLTFQQILHHVPDEFEYPESMPEVAVDLCRKLLRQNPIERIGVKSYDDLKGHPFFEGICWETLDEAEATYIPKAVALPTPSLDGATNDWQFAGVLSELQEMSPAESQIILAKPQVTTRGKNERWNKFLVDGEDIVFTGLVTKRKGIFSTKRQLILTTGPRLICVDPDRMKQRGEIPWSKDIYIHAKTDKTFDIVTSKRAYHITDRANGSRGWQEAITSVLHGNFAY